MDCRPRPPKYSPLPSSIASEKPSPAAPRANRPTPELPMRAKNVLAAALFVGARRSDRSKIRAPGRDWAASDTVNAPSVASRAADRARTCFASPRACSSVWPAASPSCTREANSGMASNRDMSIASVSCRVSPPTLAACCTALDATAPPTPARWAIRSAASVAAAVARRPVARCAPRTPRRTRAPDPTEPARLGTVSITTSSSSEGDPRWVATAAASSPPNVSAASISRMASSRRACNSGVCRDRNPSAVSRPAADRKLSGSARPVRAPMSPTVCTRRAKPDPKPRAMSPKAPSPRLPAATASRSSSVAAGSSGGVAIGPACVGWASRPN